jgi:hypothetical protein
MKTCLVVLFFWVIVSCSACSTCPDFVRAVDGYTKVILPDYRNYVNADPSLSPDTKRIRIQTADKFQELVDAARE